MLKITPSAAKLPPTPYELNPKFGTIFSPYYLQLIVKRSQPDQLDARILPMEEKLKLSPGTAALHYGQSIFEGMKAYRLPDNSVGIFRADLHARRFRKSANRMGMFDLPEEVFTQCLQAYVRQCQDQVPGEANHSLYLRPLMFAADPMIKVGASDTFEFLIMSTVAGSYFTAGTAPRPAKVMVSPQFVRAFPGGTGEVKTAANYAVSLYPQSVAASKGCDQVMYLDAVHREYVDELGGMNFFAIRGRELLTPSLNGCILDGVTRRSILEIAPQLDLKPVETKMSFPELVKEIENGTVQEAFACGTAAVVSPIGEFLYQPAADQEFRPVRLQGDGKTTMTILEKISRVQRGQEEAPGQWLLKV